MGRSTRRRRRSLLGEHYCGGRLRRACPRKRAYEVAREVYIALSTRIHVDYTRATASRNGFNWSLEVECAGTGEEVEAVTKGRKRSVTGSRDSRLLNKRSEEAEAINNL